jgi:hypothetical protein
MNINDRVHVIGFDDANVIGIMDNRVTVKHDDGEICCWDIENLVVLDTENQV